MKELMMKLWKDEEGQGLTEYALVLAGIAIVVIATLLLIGQRVENVYQEVLARLNEHGPGTNVNAPD